MKDDVNKNVIPEEKKGNTVILTIKIGNTKKEELVIRSKEKGITVSEYVRQTLFGNTHGITITDVGNTDKQKGNTVGNTVIPLVIPNNEKVIPKETVEDRIKKHKFTLKELIIIKEFRDRGLDLLEFLRGYGFSMDLTSNWSNYKPIIEVKPCR